MPCKATEGIDPGTSGRPRHQRGFTLLEMVVVVILIGLLLVIAIDRLIRLQAVAERVAMEQVLGGLRSALTLELAQRIVQGGTGDLDTLAHANPMDWLITPPVNYAGALNAPDPADVSGGQWYYNTRSRTLVYRVAHSGDFHTALPGAPRARFKVRLVYADNPGSGAHTADVVGVRLAPVEPYHWLRPAMPGD
ncbi:MAG: hypothetical protein B7Z66_02850 [Chromatiales bacterium 21-64-14]|nr:MAG: hypothetical protein B7Z66_02850 [Chromatiales bacterium 21-64-14]HQU14561.1 type II secretion system protein [Gammaproteobacteria bacterium]